MPAPARIDLWDLLGILRLSHKYDVQDLYRRALDHLNKDGEYYRMKHNDCGTQNVIHNDDESPLDYLSIIASAQEVGALWLLPCTYYSAATSSADKLLHILDGKLQEHAQKCLTAHVHLVRGTIECNSFLAVRDPCRTAKTCNAVRDSDLVTMFADVEKEADLNPLSLDWKMDIYPKLKKQGLCDACCKSAKTRHNLAATNFWNKPPKIFGLPAWEDLHAMKRAAMDGDDDSDDDSDETD
jgi:hypothetical protein